MEEQTYFPLISGEIAIDFVNTEVIRWGKRHELLTNTATLEQWLHTMSTHHLSLQYILQKHEHTLSETDVADMLTFRNVLRQAYDIVIHKKDCSSLIELMQQTIRETPFIFTLFQNEVIPIPTGNYISSLQSLICLNVLQLIANNQLQQLRHCQNEACILLFIDKTGRRKWCSMKICGNRTKVTKHIQKNKQVE
ncbi:CGNR zinc finger domain-containing protein [Bacillus cereus group sp. BfR-BA-01380]|uniref:CGNR zinc finger domain-containing protein n=1 Tax=Bacillus cereus group sp. BfR-BA-01380 TaxID=2920324 RepID=UPI001F5A6A15|nr:CGNR zinc finger domain-containing protein [Bacillus cereus group sp. BfR-BA-01380]